VQRHRRLRKRIGTLILCLAGSLPWAALPLAAQSHHFVYLSSASDHTVSGFEIDPSSGVVTPVAGSPFDEGHDPSDLAFHPSGHFLYALNRAENSVSGFSVDPATGALSELPASPFAVGAGAAPQFIAVEPSGNYLYVVSTLDDPIQGTFTRASYYSIDTTGALSPAPEDTSSYVSLSPVGFASSGDRFLYVAGTGSSNQVCVLALELDPPTGALSAVHFSPVSGQFAKSMALAPGGPYLFLGYGQSQGWVDTYALSADGTFSQPVSTFSLSGASTGPSALATDVSGSHLYAAVPNLGLVGFSVDSGSGALSALPDPPFVGPPISPAAVMAADPETLFPNLYYEQRVFEISATGLLSELLNSPLAVSGSVTGIAAASPLDSAPVAPVSAPAISLAPSSLQFSDQFIGGASAPRSVSLTNTGNALLLLSDISLTGINAADFALSHNCLAVLKPNDGCNISITFQPLLEGASEASLTVVDNASGSPQTVALSGTAQTPFTLRLNSSTSTIQVGQTAQYDLTVVPHAGFAGGVQLACAGEPEQATCEVLPPSLYLNGGVPAQFSVKVFTSAPSTLLPLLKRFDPPENYEHSLPLLTPATILAALFLLSFSFSMDLETCPGRRHKPNRAILALVICASLVSVACSGPAGPSTAHSTSPPTSASPPSEGPAPSPTGGTAAGQYSLTVTASFGVVTESIPLSLSIQ
jgi:6-phosphogluconolactonase